MKIKWVPVLKGLRKGTVFRCSNVFSLMISEPCWESTTGIIIPTLFIILLRCSVKDAVWRPGKLCLWINTKFLPVCRNYILTTPRQFISEHDHQLCVFVTDPAAPAGSLNVSLSIWDSSKLPENRNQTIFQQILDIPSGLFLVDCFL